MQTPRDIVTDLWTLAGGERAALDAVTLTGEAVSFSDQGAVIKLENGKFSERVAWFKFTPESLKVLGENPKAKVWVDPILAPPEVKAEPLEALMGDTDVHRRLSVEAAAWLRPGGWLVMEIGAEQGAEVRALLAGRFADIEVIRDLAGRERVIRGRRRHRD